MDDFTNLKRFLSVLACIVLGIALVNSIDPNHFSVGYVVLIALCWLVLYTRFDLETYKVKAITVGIVVSGVLAVTVSGIYQSVAYWYSNNYAPIGSLFVDCGDGEKQEIEYSADQAGSILEGTSLYSCELVFYMLDEGYELATEQYEGTTVVYPYRVQEKEFAFRINPYWTIEFPD